MITFELTVFDVLDLLLTNLSCRKKNRWVGSHTPDLVMDVLSSGGRKLSLMQDFLFVLCQ